jgi:nitrite reductase (NADH) large subunit
MCGCTDHTHQEVRDAIREQAADGADVMQLHGMAHAQRLRQLPAGAQLLPDLDLAEGGQDDPQSRYINERSHANIQKDGTYSVIPRMWGGETTRRRTAPHRRRGRQVQDPHRQGHGRPAHRPAGREEGRPAECLERHRHAVGPPMPRAAHGEDLRGQRMVPLRHPGLHADGQGPGAALWRMYAPHKVKLAVSGCPRNCAESGIKDVGVIGVDSGWEIYVGGNGGIKTEVAQFFVQAEDA